MSLEGKANRLASMIRGNLGMAMQGLSVVPLFAGYDVDTRQRPDLLLRRDRRLLRGARPPQRRLRLALRPRVAEEALARRAGTLDDAVRVAVEALYDAADDDSATGGPDVGRRIWPTVGDRRRRRRPVRRRRRGRPGRRRDHRLAAATTREVPDDADAVLRLARAADEGPGRLRPQGHRPRPVGRRPRLRQRHRLRRARTPAGRCTRSPRSTTASRSPRSASTTSSRTCGSPGVRYADLRGYSYDRSDVTARGLANAYAQTLGTVFTQESKPYEVEIVVAEVGTTPGDDQVYRLTYDGSVADEHGFVAMGGASRADRGRRSQERWREGLNLVGGAHPGRRRSSAPTRPVGPSRDLQPEQLEVAVLDRHRPRRTFRRIAGPLLERLLSSEDPTSDAPPADDADAGGRAPVTPAGTRRPTRRRSAPTTRGRPREHPGAPADLRHRERVRHHLLDRRPAHPDARRGGPLPLPQGRRLGPVEQRLPPQRLAALPRRRLAPRVRHRRVRLACGRSSSTTRRGSGSSRASSSTPSSGCARTASRATSTSSRTTPTRPATPTAATRTTSSTRAGEFATISDTLLPFLISRQITCGAGKVVATSQGRDVCREPAGRPHLGGRVLGDDAQPADHQHPRRAARRRRALPPAARHRRRLEHERDDDDAQGRLGRPRPADDRGRRGHARPDAGEPDPRHPRDQPRHRPAAAPSAWPTGAS